MWIVLSEISSARSMIPAGTREEVYVPTTDGLCHYNTELLTVNFHDKSKIYIAMTRRCLRTNYGWIVPL